MSDWRDIKSDPPPRGTKILLWCAEKKYDGDTAIGTLVGRCNENGDMYYLGALVPWKFTHWQPDLEPPHSAANLRPTDQEPQ